MKDKDTKRQSHCTLCGKRLSQQKPSGDIHWQPSQVDDKGIYCGDCFAQTKKHKSGKPSKAK